ANAVNWQSVAFWAEQGIKRVILARELSLSEITEIRHRVPHVELEMFVHGAMCIAYSGRCLLSNYMTFRDANRGECSHPCRYNYALVEEKRPGQYYPIEEDERGAYIMNSKDLCLFPHLKEIMDTGIHALKIEGRMKSVNYTATVTHAYRQAIDAIAAGCVPEEALYRELFKINHREYTTAFLFGEPKGEAQAYLGSKSQAEAAFLGIVLGWDKERGLLVEQRGFFRRGQEVECISPGRGSPICFTVSSIIDASSNLELDVARHAQQHVYLPYPEQLPIYSILRSKDN
ncbi:MAG: U32 family peptidase C-terminal domain-containing protein, partial [bacterium]|nr:U32 family peptidase C-terminal domain-containing protein [bacterium]